MEKKVSEFTIQDMLPLGLTFVVLAIALAYGASVLGDVKADQVTNTASCNSTDTDGCGYAYNTSAKGEEAVYKFGSKLPLIATVVVAAVIIGILITYLAVRFMK